MMVVCIVCGCEFDDASDYRPICVSCRENDYLGDEL